MRASTAWMTLNFCVVVKIQLLQLHDDLNLKLPKLLIILPVEVKKNKPSERKNCLVKTEILIKSVSLYVSYLRRWTSRKMVYLGEMFQVGGDGRNLNWLVYSARHLNPILLLGTSSNWFNHYSQNYNRFWLAYPIGELDLEQKYASHFFWLFLPRLKSF